MILVIALHILVCSFLILVVLLQSGKAGDLASTFGGAGSQTAFGTRSAATLLTKLTAVSAVLFMVTCLLLSSWSQRGESSVMPVNAPQEASQTGSSEVGNEPAPASETPVAPSPQGTESHEEGQVPDSSDNN